MASIRHPMWQNSAVESVCAVLAGTDHPGLSGSEITTLLSVSRVSDVDPSTSKRKRLWAALMTQQQRDQAANCIIKFITEAMAPGRYVQNRARFEALKDALNEPLALMGLRVNEVGKPARGARAANFDEVARLAGRLQSELRRRGVHPQVIKYCEEEILRQKETASPGPHQRLRHRKQDQRAQGVRQPPQGRIRCLPQPAGAHPSGHRRMAHPRTGRP
nr:hypothetical protein [Nocardiopsis listeri]